MVLIAITSRHRLAAAPITVAAGASHFEHADALWDLLESEDPDSSPARTLRVI